MSFSTIYRIFVDYRMGLFNGLIRTAELSAIIWTAGLVFGVLLGVLAYRKSRTIGLVLTGSSFLMASVPVLILLFWAHYPLQELLGVVIDPFVTAATALSLLNIITIGQLIRGALAEFPDQYRIAGIVCGMSRGRIFRTIEMPILARQLIPQVLVQQVNMLQMTLFASLISVEELFRVAQHINSIIYKPVEIYTTLALFFVAICLPLNLIASGLKLKYTRNMSEK